MSTCDSSIYVHVSLSNWIIFIVLQDKEHSRPILLVRLRIINRKLKELAVSTICALTDSCLGGLRACVGPRA